MQESEREQNVSLTFNTVRIENAASPGEQNGLPTPLQIRLLSHLGGELKLQRHSISHVEYLRKLHT